MLRGDLHTVSGRGAPTPCASASGDGEARDRLGCDEYRRCWRLWTLGSRRSVKERLHAMGGGVAMGLEMTTITTMRQSMKMRMQTRMRGELEPQRGRRREDAEPPLPIKEYALARSALHPQSTILGAEALLASLSSKFLRHPCLLCCEWPTSSRRWVASSPPSRIAVACDPWTLAGWRGWTSTLASRSNFA